MLSVVGIKGYKFDIRDQYDFRSSPTPIINENLMLPDILLEENEDIDFTQRLKIIFDQIWNACGFSQSINYDAVGKWRENI